MVWACVIGGAGAGDGGIGGLERWFSPLTSRLLLVNLLPLLFMRGMLLSINAVRNTLLAGSVEALREQARIYASVLQQARSDAPGHAHKGRAGNVPSSASTAEGLDIGQAHLLLDDMVRYSGNAEVRLYTPNGCMLTESCKSAVSAEGTRWQPGVSIADRLYGWVLSIIPLRTHEGEVPLDDSTLSQDFGRETDEDVHMAPQAELPPYIRLTANHELVMTVVEPVMLGGGRSGSSS